MLLRRDTFGELFRDMNRLSDEMNRVFGRRGGLGGSLLAFNVWEDEHSVFAEADLPGVDPNKLDVSVTEGNLLTVQGERPVLELANASWIRQERGAGTFTRTITLPTLVDAAKVTANYEAGVLKIVLPKAEAAKPRKIAVKSN